MLDSLFGGQLGTVTKFAIAFVFVLGLIGITALILKRFGGGMPTSGGGRNRQPRLSVLDSLTADSNLNLVLVPPDDSDHLLLILAPTYVPVPTTMKRARPQATPGPGVHLTVCRALHAGDLTSRAAMTTAVDRRLAERVTAALDSLDRAPALPHAAALREPLERIRKRAEGGAAPPADGAPPR